MWGNGEKHFLTDRCGRGNWGRPGATEVCTALEKEDWKGNEFLTIWYLGWSLDLYTPETKGQIIIPNLLGRKWIANDDESGKKSVVSWLKGQMLEFHDVGINKLLILNSA